jgi:hypothetical protein
VTVAAFNAKTATPAATLAATARFLVGDPAGDSWKVIEAEDVGNAILPTTIPTITTGGTVKKTIVYEHEQGGIYEESFHATDYGGYGLNIIRSFGFNGFGDRRDDPDIPSMGTEWEYDYRAGPQDEGQWGWMEPHLLKVNVGAPGSTVGVRAFSWTISDTNNANYQLYYALRAHAHHFVCFTQDVGGTPNEGNPVLSLSRTAVRFFSTDISLGPTSGGTGYTLGVVGGLTVTGAAGRFGPIIYDATDVTISSRNLTLSGAAFINSGAADWYGQGAVLLAKRPSGTNVPQVFVQSRGSNAVYGYGSGVTADGQLRIGQAEPSYAGNEQGLYWDATAGSPTLRVIAPNGAAYTVNLTAV